MSLGSTHLSVFKESRNQSFGYVNQLTFSSKNLSYAFSSNLKVEKANEKLFYLSESCQTKVVGIINYCRHLFDQEQEIEFDVYLKNEYSEGKNGEMVTTLKKIQEFIQSKNKITANIHFDFFKFSSENNEYYKRMSSMGEPLKGYIKFAKIEVKMCKKDEIQDLVKNFSDFLGFSTKDSSYLRLTFCMNPPE